MWYDIRVVVLRLSAASSLLCPRRQHAHVERLILQVALELVVGRAAVASRGPLAHLHHHHHHQRREDEGEHDPDQDA